MTNATFKKIDEKFGLTGEALDYLRAQAGSREAFKIALRGQIIHGLKAIGQVDEGWIPHPTSSALGAHTTTVWRCKF